MCILSAPIPEFKPAGKIMRGHPDNSLSPIDQNVAASLPTARLFPRFHPHIVATQFLPTAPEIKDRQTTRQPALPPPLQPSPVVALATTGKRRLGMGRGVTGYPNKKFKPPI
ncbi:hypothetical protein BDN72DRAFT_563418 [Pluteus cervinus]|uniref:Uncharacterized protein n=1 Tax=Pluteus cervinus TaxID=181527 RepID=A0ACD3BBL1_9AGAR|nr:hypothetical protein BDN72DRAFT_563418 [Pluteus cervinus]